MEWIINIFDRRFIRSLNVTGTELLDQEHFIATKFSGAAVSACIQDVQSRVAARGGPGYDRVGQRGLREAGHPALSTHQGKSHSFDNILVSTSDMDLHWSYADTDPQNLVNAIRIQDKKSLNLFLTIFYYLFSLFLMSQNTGFALYHGFADFEKCRIEFARLGLQCLVAGWAVELSEEGAGEVCSQNYQL